MKKKILSPLPFKTGVAINAFGSTIFEGLKIAHQSALLFYTSLYEYGKIGALFSLIFATISFAGLNLENTIPVFINEIFSTKKMCKTIMGVLISSQIALLLGGATLLLSVKGYLASYIPLTPLLSGIVVTTIISEGLRILFRSILHARAIHTAPIVSELATMIVYFLWVWISFFIYKKPLSLFFIFAPYCICSLLALGVLSLFIYWHYTTLPLENGKETFPWKRFFRTRLFTYGSRLSSLFFTGNVLVPFFMVKFGLRESGLFKFASYGIDALKGILHSTIGFSSSALFAKVKYASWEEKKKAFYEASSLLNTILTGITIFVVFNIHSLSSLSAPSLHDRFFIFMIFFFLLFLCDQSMLVYEKLYSMEERADILIITKLTELLAGIFILSYSPNSSIATILFFLSLVRIGSFVMLGGYAYKAWNIFPHLRIRFMPCFVSLIVSFLISFFYTAIISYL